jgi:hypothetical protein
MNLTGPIYLEYQSITGISQHTGSPKENIPLDAPLPLGKHPNK